MVKISRRMFDLEAGEIDHAANSVFCPAHDSLLRGARKQNIRPFLLTRANLTISNNVGRHAFRLCQGRRQRLFPPGLCCQQATMRSQPGACSNLAARWPDPAAYVQPSEPCPVLAMTPCAIISIIGNELGDIGRNPAQLKSTAS